MGYVVTRFLKHKELNIFSANQIYEDRMQQISDVF